MGKLVEELIAGFPVAADIVTVDTFHPVYDEFKIADKRYYDFESPLCVVTVICADGMLYVFSYDRHRDQNMTKIDLADPDSVAKFESCLVSEHRAFLERHRGSQVSISSGAERYYFAGA